MSDTRVLSLRDAASHTGGSLASSLTVAGVTAAIGWFLVHTTLWQPHHLLASLISFAILAGIVNLTWLWHMAGTRFGEANQATLLRAGLVCLIGSTLLASDQPPAASWHLVALVTLALTLDAVDGFLARRLRLTSTFGARFDMEIDALLLLILSLLVWQIDQTGIWVLAIGLMRYAFVAAGWVYPVLASALGPSLRRKCVCALQGIALLACLLPPLDQTSAVAIAALALAALTASFGLDIAALMRRRGGIAAAGEATNP